MPDVDLSGDLPPFFGGDMRNQLQQAERIINALRKLKVVALLPSGQQMSGSIQISEGGSIVYLRPDAGGAGGTLGGTGSTSSSPPTATLDLCDGSTITVLLAPGTSA